MKIEDEITSALKARKIILGLNETMSALKSRSPKSVIVAKNIPESKRKDIEYNSKIFKVKLEIFEGTSKQLGVICGKPFPVSALAIM